MRLQSANLVPAARSENLVTTESRDETLVYDTASNHIHHLNQVSAVIWRLCDGRRSVDDIVHAAALELGAELNDTSVRIALGKLESAGLLVEALRPGIRLEAQSRRTLLKRAAVAGTVALPVIVSISAPRAAAASSHGGSQSCGVGCTGDNNCNGCCSQCNGDGQTVPQFSLGICYNPNTGGAEPQLTCNSN